jgi:excisionase family DNA binding protein
MALSEYLTVAEAQELLGVTKRKMADLISRGDIPSEENPFDRRSKLVRRADVEKLKTKMPAGKEAA